MFTLRMWDGESSLAVRVVIGLGTVMVMVTVAVGVVKLAMEDELPLGVLYHPA